MRTTRNPKVDGIEIYDPNEEQIRAMRQGIYESLVRKAIGLPYNAPFRDRSGIRLDAKRRFPDAFRQAFAMSTSVGQRTGRLHYGSQRSTEMSTMEAEKRYLDVDHLLRNRQDYEETLGIYRKSGFYRVTMEPTRSGKKLFVWPMPPQDDDEPVSFLIRDKEELEGYYNYANRELDPRETGIWWKPPKKLYTESQLEYWLPPYSVFR